MLKGGRKEGMKGTSYPFTLVEPYGPLHCALSVCENTKSSLYSKTLLLSFIKRQWKA